MSLQPVVRGFSDSAFVRRLSEVVPGGRGRCGRWRRPWHWLVIARAGIHISGGRRRRRTRADADMVDRQRG